MISSTTARSTPRPASPVRLAAGAHHHLSHDRCRAALLGHGERKGARRKRTPRWSGGADDDPCSAASSLPLPSATSSPGQQRITCGVATGTAAVSNELSVCGNVYFRAGISKYGKHPAPASPVGLAAGAPSPLEARSLSGRSPRSWREERGAPRRRAPAWGGGSAVVEGDERRRRWPWNGEHRRWAKLCCCFSNTHKNFSCIMSRGRGNARALY
ncbi:hypothetical protein BRADI_5g01482v3 [Brachypodium distachyon]|uniref:Uncharacterized protein n=1 Tax=Brachypodium distachyon TaxID=15368 RepID=A0A2K2CEV1_BRADI|nr:hypothetical protein BRADI_5g01482v3 [Brachypodium distachyon]